MEPEEKLTRRNFLSGVATIGLSSTLGSGLLFTSCSEKGKQVPLHPVEELYIPELPDKAIDGKPIKTALIGCGGRGIGAAFNFLDAGNDLSIVALADLFPDKLEAGKQRLKDGKNVHIPDEMCFTGFDAYRKVCELPIDLVLIASPNCFHPEHMKYAIEKGKHVFVEKPAAIDPAGYRTFVAAARQAVNTGINVLPGTQYHFDRPFVTSYRKVQEGLIGSIISGYAYYHTGRDQYIVRRPEWSDMEYCIRNWFNIKWLSGDHLLDQAIHNIDVVTWFMEDRPIRAVGFGGRAQRLTGDIYDFFSVDYYYNNNKRMLATARQIDGCDGNVSEQVYGTKGMASLNDRGEIKIVDYNGNILWEYDYQNKPVKNPYDQEHVHFVESIRLDKKINQAEALAYSTQVAILGREAAYTGKPISWDEIMASTLRYGPEKYEMGALPDYKEGEAPKPGKAPDAPVM